MCVWAVTADRSHVMCQRQVCNYTGNAQLINVRRVLQFCHLRSALFPIN